MGLGDNRMEIMAHENKATDFLEHIRSRIRIIRAAAINTPLVGLTILFFLQKQVDQYSGMVVMSIVFATILVFFSLFLCLGVLEITYQKRLEQTLQSKDSVKRDSSPNHSFNQDTINRAG